MVCEIASLCKLLPCFGALKINLPVLGCTWMMGNMICTKAGHVLDHLPSKWKSGMESRIQHLQPDPGSDHQRPPECPMNLHPEAVDACFGVGKQGWDSWWQAAHSLQLQCPSHSSSLLLVIGASELPIAGSTKLMGYGRRWEE